MHQKAPELIAGEIDTQTVTSRLNETPGEIDIGTEAIDVAKIRLTIFAEILIVIGVITTIAASIVAIIFPSRASIINALGCGTQLFFSTMQDLEKDGQKKQRYKRFQISTLFAIAINLTTYDL